MQVCKFARLAARLVSIFAELWLGNRGIIWPKNVLNSCYGHWVVHCKSHADAVSDTDAI